MTFKEFFQWMRRSGERYIVLNAEGEPEFVIEPFQKEKISTVEKINETIAAVAEKEREELNGWDTMVHTLQQTSPSSPIDSAAATPNADEQQFQFEAIDE